VRFFRWLSSLDLKNDWTSWSALWRAVPLLFFVFYFSSQAVTENNAASRQQTSYGLVSDCHNASHGEHFCDYAFPTNGDEYRGSGSVSQNVQLGSTVLVYYDSHDPSNNALEGFSEQSRKDRDYAFLFLALTAIIIAIVLWRNL
jgi:hypothetical protein